MSEKKKPEVFAQEVYEVWGDKVELLTPYTRCTDKILVRFNECGHECWKNPNKLLAGQGCSMKECHYGLLSKNKTRSSEQYLSDLAAKGFRYELVTPFTGVKNDITVKNLNCGHTYTANAGNILGGSGCPVCHGFKNTELFKKQIIEKYPGEYTVIGKYVNNRVPILVEHKCGYQWEVIPKDLMRSIRCPNCNKSRGEKAIENFLVSHNLKFKSQYSFPDCCDKQRLLFDFAVFPEDGIKLIEFDGSQHFAARNSGWNTEENLSGIQRRDKIKNDYCESHNIPLLRIPYWKIKSVDDLLASFLNIQL